MIRRDLLARPASQVAPALIGAVLRVDSPDGEVQVRLTEVEAYEGPSDPASHAWRGPTPRTAVMFGAPGHLYVYFSYGMHWCANIVCHPGGAAGAVLLRAGEVVGGLALARHRRPTARTDRDLARGPARLTAALAVTGADTGADLLDPRGRFSLVLPGDPEPVRSGPRVGISRAAERPWRFWQDGAPSVSAFRRGGRPPASGPTGAADSGP